MAETTPYVGWEEVVACGDKGHREIRYYLQRGGDAAADLVVVGKERSLRHISYSYVDEDKLLSSLKCTSLLKLRSRREVIDWLNSIVPAVHRHCSFEHSGGSMGNNEPRKFGVNIIKDVQMFKPSLHAADVMWLGSPWTCRKRRRHYASFYRNGIKISVHDFVYVLAEEGKRLVAYLNDMYENARGNKMVVVRWFDKIDEVGFVLPRNYNDREIFFSPCLQDLSIECVDGLATVLSPDDYGKFLNGASTSIHLEPFVCCKHFDNDDVWPFDITRLEGYWRQEIVRNIYSASSSLATHSDAVGTRRRKRLRMSKERVMHFQPLERGVVDGSLHDNFQGFPGSECNKRTGSPGEGGSSAYLPGQGQMVQMLAIGSQVEVLCQDSGIRGCWFRALIIKKHKDKVKVKYEDIKDAADDAKNLEEWVLASRLAAKDGLDIRIFGRTIVRPMPLSDKAKVSWVVKVGSIVDAWWHDGWWEGIVVKKQSEDKLHVYFPGEKKESIFSLKDLRPSQEWVENGWKAVKEMPELVSKLYGMESKSSGEKISDVTPGNVPDESRDLADHGKVLPPNKVEYSSSVSVTNEKVPKELGATEDLSKDIFLSQLKWSSGKRSRSPVRKFRYGINGSGEYSSTDASVFGRSTLSVDPDNCKYAGDSPFGSSVVSPLTSLVMSR